MRVFVILDVFKKKMPPRNLHKMVDEKVHFVAKRKNWICGEAHLPAMGFCTEMRGG